MTTYLLVLVLFLNYSIVCYFKGNNRLIYLPPLNTLLRWPSVFCWVSPRGLFGQLASRSITYVLSVARTSVANCLQKLMNFGMLGAWGAPKSCNWIWLRTTYLFINQANTIGHVSIYIIWAILPPFLNTWCLGQLVHKLDNLNASPETFNYIWLVTYVPTNVTDLCGCVAFVQEQPVYKSIYLN